MAYSDLSDFREEFVTDVQEWDQERLYRPFPKLVIGQSEGSLLRKL